MATVTLLAWDPSCALSSAVLRLIERHGGQSTVWPGIALFTGSGDAMAAAVAWQQTEQAEPSTPLAVNVAEFDQHGSVDESAAASLTRNVVRRGRPGDILGTEIVRLLLPVPTGGTWSTALASTIGSPEQLVHQFLWRRSTEAQSVTVVVAEDAAIIRAGLVSLLRGDGMTIVGEAADYDEVIAAVRTSRPRLLITDIRMPPEQGDEGLRAAELLRSEQPGLAVLVLSQHVQASAAADLLTGQTSGFGYLLKERVTALDEFLDAARSVAAGGTVIDPLITRELLSRRRDSDPFATLGERERAVLELMAQGLSNVAIADRLVLSHRTVESHVRSIMTKLDLWEDPAGNRRVQAVIRWLNQH